jgi:hypothetical protein
MFKAAEALPLFICRFMMFNSRYLALYDVFLTFKGHSHSFPDEGLSERLIYYLKDIRIIKHFVETSVNCGVEPLTDEGNMSNPSGCHILMGDTGSKEKVKKWLC